MSVVLFKATIPETASCSEVSRRFGDLRGVQWRIDLGILPSSASASIDDIRRVTANSRRRYAALRRRLLVDPNVLKDGSSSPDLVMDNPLSQNPDSIWGRFFRNAELERMVDQDLTRLYPERGSYFQTSECQGILRRILLLWSLRHPEYGYRQGMHELLAPLLYVLHVDVERLSEVRRLHDDHFADKFDGFSFYDNDLTYKFDFKKFEEDGNGSERSFVKAITPCEVEPEIQTIILLSDAYGSEGELGVVLSDKFMEHDAYSLFDALMRGGDGSVAMAHFFSPSPSHTGLPHVIESSAALYHLLSIVDTSLHCHLNELGVEPQYFALRWLRVLFGREFSLEDLLVIWDEIFSCENTKLVENLSESHFCILESPRGAFISSFAVSMILHLRSSLLATETATACLQRLLSFPEDVKLEKVTMKAKSLQHIAVGANNLNSVPINPGGLYDGRKSVRGHSLSLDLNSLATPLSVLPDSYWEEKWRVLHKDKGEVEEEIHQIPIRRKGWSDKVKLRLSRTESDPSSNLNTKIPKPSVRRNLLTDLARQLGSDKDEDNGLEGEDNLSNYSSQPSHENDLESSVESNSFIDENDAQSDNPEVGLVNTDCSSPLPVSQPPDNDDSQSDKPINSSNSLKNVDFKGKKSITDVKEKKLLSNKFQWLWKFGRNGSDGTSERRGKPEDVKVFCNDKSVVESNVAEICKAGECSGNTASNGETVEHNAMVTLRNLGQSMLENIQVIESLFQQEQCQITSSDNLLKNELVGKGQVKAVSALKELRKISNLLSEM